MNVQGILKGKGKISGIGAFKTGREIRLLFLRPRYYSPSANHRGNAGLGLFSAKSNDGFSFRETREIFIKDVRGRNLNIKNLSAVRVGGYGEKKFSIFKINKGLISSVYSGRTDDSSISTIGRIAQISETAGIVPDYKLKGNFVAFCGGSDIRILSSANLSKWRINKKPILTTERDNKIEIGTVEKLNQGILVIYFEAKSVDNEKFFYSINAAIFDDKNPQNLVFKTRDPIWEQPLEWNESQAGVKPFGLVAIGDKMISYWEFGDGSILAIIHEKRAKIHEERIRPPEILLKKHHENPILQPDAGNFWESKATFNPAAIYDQGRVHLVYRAIGDHDMSMLGYASSRDGVHIDFRSRDPIYVPTQPFEFSRGAGQAAKTIPLSAYASGGGGYGGVEDPRLTKIGKKIYMTYVAYDGMGPPRVALTSIAVSDFRKKNWKWETPMVISKPNVVDKNAVIFPEQIAGKFCIMHRIFPNILIDYVDSLDFDGKTYLPGEYKISPRNLYWDSRKIGAGAPPIKTDSGWLLIYQAVGNDDPSRYKIGAMLLDLEDPTKVVARTMHPILQPDEGYENEGYKSGVAYPCGAVNKDGTLLVYYGGADTVSCVARANLASFVSDLTQHHVGELKNIEL